MTTFRSEAKSLLPSFERLLWEEWDPIGVRQIGDDWPEDEYDSYAPKLLALVASGKLEAEIEAYLVKLETEHMGLKPSGRSGPVATRAIELFRVQR